MYEIGTYPDDFVERITAIVNSYLIIGGIPDDKEWEKIYAYAIRGVPLEGNLPEDISKENTGISIKTLTKTKSQIQENDLSADLYENRFPNSEFDALKSLGEDCKALGNKIIEILNTRRLAVLSRHGEYRKAVIIHTKWGGKQMFLRCWETKFPELDHSDFIWSWDEKKHNLHGKSDGFNIRWQLTQGQISIKSDCPQQCKVIECGCKTKINLEEFLKQHGAYSKVLRDSTDAPKEVRVYSPVNIFDEL